MKPATLYTLLKALANPKHEGFFLLLFFFVAEKERRSRHRSGLSSGGLSVCTNKGEKGGGIGRGKIKKNGSGERNCFVWN